MKTKIFRLSSLDRTTVIKTGRIDPDVYFVAKVLTDSGSTLLTVSYYLFPLLLWGVATQKNRTLPQISNMGLVFLVFFLVFFGFFFGSSIVANFDWLNGFLLSGSCWLK